MARKSKAKKPAGKLAVGEPYAAVLAQVVDLLEAARHASARAVNAVMTTTYWQIGRRIVEHEQGGSERASYGAQLLPRLSADLGSRFGRGFSVDNLEIMRRFFLAYRERAIPEMTSRKLPARISETPSRKSSNAADQINRPRALFPLPWSHYVKLLSVDNRDAREFYETEALRGGWTVKQLHRQIGTQFYERTLMSRNKAAMLTKHNRRRPADAVTIEEEIKDP